MLNRELPIRCLSYYGQPILRIAASGRYLILTAINSVYPIALAKIYYGAEARRLSMEPSILQWVLSWRMKPDYQVLENIFLKQLGLDEQSAFQERLYLVYGDQKTLGCLRLYEFALLKQDKFPCMIGTDRIIFILFFLLRLVL